MTAKVRPDFVLVQAVIAGALSFAHLHDLAEAAGQTGWKAWAYPVSVDLLLVAAWRRLRTARRDRSAWTWFVIALTASLGANIATAGLLDLADVPAWLRILVAGWPALAFLGGTLLVHSPAEPAAPAQPVEESAAPEVETHRVDEPEPVPEIATPEPVPALPEAPAPVVPPALIDHARKVATDHRTRTGTDIDTATLRTRLGIPEDLAGAIVAQLA
ncbi:MULTISPECIES: DUF2637 domain-containing protein [Streptomyces]|uniref:DUF2637 domain-containing protein n=1 Tax=Streptomyces koelreuteriae TaxID=2838015 RepID=A0ABX8FX12_9ACTN|nr:MULTISPECIES: DUF2637 domain-containing protein [Streptomyces]QWB25606.1 DUF2637 domain-containing protein [Streptomyces koelreuteriae]UUA08655.1 DUF2637 domain-containing protein [Streptomyces koelreuteriae]UUA16260.1 DUF2637 domain-containing protein [Streptomyces sp. CRCS-T-1]